MYKFREQFKQGRAAERYLDSLFIDEFHIKEATREQERRGIDRIFTRRSSGEKFTIQYKADRTAAKTGNAFIETVSVDTKGIKGWAYTCQADYIFYYVVGMGPVYIVKPEAIKENLNRWKQLHPSRQIPNYGRGGGKYNTHGLLVPLDELEKVAIQIVSV
jgi:hypothetical protein